MQWDPFLMKVLMKKEFYGSREQCMRPIGKGRNALQKKKKKNIDANADAIINIQMST